MLKLSQLQQTATDTATATTKKRFCAVFETRKKKNLFAYVVCHTIRSNMNFNAKISFAVNMFRKYITMLAEQYTTSDKF